MTPARLDSGSRSRLDVGMAELYGASFAQFVVRRGRFCPPPVRLDSVLLAAIKDEHQRTQFVAPPPAPVSAPDPPPTSAASLAPSAGSRPYKCKVPGCTSLFGKANHLSRHIRIVHNKERPFRCEVSECNSRFGSRSHLVDHVNAVHKRLRNFRCERCNAAFSKSFNLAKHKRLMHTKVAKSHRCLHCDLSFGTRSHLTRHATKVHPLRRSSDGISRLPRPSSPVISPVASDESAPSSPRAPQSPTTSSEGRTYGSGAEHDSGVDVSMSDAAEE